MKVHGRLECCNFLDILLQFGASFAFWSGGSDLEHSLECDPIVPETALIISECVMCVKLKDTVVFVFFLGLLSKMFYIDHCLFFVTMSFTKVTITVTERSTGKPSRSPILSRYAVTSETLD